MGPQNLLSVRDALARVLATTPAPQSETVAISDALGRTLAAPIAAPRDQPPFRSSAMDGYAVRSADAVEGAQLMVIGESAAGHIFDRALGPGEAVRIFTGGAVPEGADAVLIQENATREGPHVRVDVPAAEGRNIRAAGLDFRSGDVLIDAGTLLSPRMVGLAAATGHTEIAVARRPCVAILSTGDELVRPGEEPRPGQITSSNSFTLAALVTASGGEPLDFGIVRDTLDSIRDAVRRAREAGADVLVTTGGASVGDHDLVRPALEAEGLVLDFWRIAMRPGRPMMSGTLGTVRMLGLPGNPVSAHVCAVLFLVPLIRALLGRSEIGHTLERARLGQELPQNDWREDYVRAHLAFDGDGNAVATPFERQDSSMLRVLADANCLIVRPAEDPARAPGDLCRILRLGALS
jgi:molybdopterin molybdotransferase